MQRIKSTIRRILGVSREDDGVLTFEWTLLLSLLTIGIVAGLSSARDAIIDELADIAEAVVHIDQTVNVAAFDDCGVTAPGFTYTDTLPLVTRCGRSNLPGNAPAAP